MLGELLLLLQLPMCQDSHTGASLVAHIFGCDE
jgi:hypothetical protein